MHSPAQCAQNWWVNVGEEVVRSFKQKNTFQYIPIRNNTYSIHATAHIIHSKTFQYMSIRTILGACFPFLNGVQWTIWLPLNSE